MNSFRVGLADDHKLLRKGLASLINGFSRYQVVFDSDNGIPLIAALLNGLSLDIVLLDVNMPEMDGLETATELVKINPSMKFMALSMYDSEATIIRMLRVGARGYILKDSEPDVLKEALDNVMDHGYHFSNIVSPKLVHNLRKDPTGICSAKRPVQLLTDRELTFLQFACTELTYKEIANKMSVSARTVDGYRESLFEKLNIKSRVGLVLYAMKAQLLK